MEQTLLAYGFPKEIVAAIMMLYKVKVRSPDRITDFFDIVACVLQGDTLAPYLIIICLRTSIDLMRENHFTVAKERSRRYPTQTITDTDYADDGELLSNTPSSAESLLHSLEMVAGGIGLHVNVDKTEYVSLNQNQTRDRWFLETSGQIHLPRKRRLIYGKWHQ